MPVFMFPSRLYRIMSLGLVLGGLLASSVVAQGGQKSAGSTTNSVAAAATSSNSTASISPYASRGVSNRARNFYQLVWGVDSFVVKSAQSGQMIRFSYRVIDAEKAKPLNSEKETPYLIDEHEHVKLVVPNMEKVGQLRQRSTPEADKTYWMLFSNKGGFVKRGNRVSVVIGRFRVDGLVVQ